MPNFLIDEDTGLLAAEFVLGTLDSAERADAQSLLKTDHGFTAMVRIWERRFGELHLMVEPVEPDAKIFERIKAKLPTTAQADPPAGKLPDLPGSPDPVKPATPPPPPATAAPEPQPPAAGAGEGEQSKTPKAAEGEETPEGEREEPIPELAAVAAVDPGVAPELGLPAAPETKPAEEAPRITGSPTAKSGPMPVPAPPPQPPPPLKLPDKQRVRQDERRDPRERWPEVTIDIIRSRRRWRALGIFMTLVVMALAGLVAAWRVVPDRLPPALRPAEVMMVIGIEQGPPVPQPPIRPPPPESQFDE
jgi:hypothetical protein